MNNYYEDIEKAVEMRKKENSRDYQALLNAGVTAQEEKLRENQHKKGFNNINLEYAVGRVYEEVEELHDAFLFNENNFPEIRREAADIANFCHMVIYKCDQELSK